MATKRQAIDSDRRVRRTQEALGRALVELILEKGFEATTVSEIVERANVGRSTFYAHFADKEDLLQASVEEMRKSLMARIAESKQQARHDAHPALSFCLPMLEHANENRPLFVAMEGRHSGYFFADLVQDMWADLTRECFEEIDEVAVQTIAGGFRATVSWWLLKEPNLMPCEVDRRFRALLEKALA